MVNSMSLYPSFYRTAQHWKPKRASIENVPPVEFVTWEPTNPQSRKDTDFGATKETTTGLADILEVIYCMYYFLILC